MKLLVISQHYWPETFRITEVVHSLREIGCEVTVLTGQPNYPDGVIAPGYRALAAGREDHDGSTIYRVPMIPRGSGSAGRLVVNYLSFLASACVVGPWLLRGQTFDVVFVYGTSPILQAIAGVWIKLLKRSRLVTWVQDLWPESMEATGFVRNKGLLAAVGTVVRWIYRRNDLLLVQSQAFVVPVQAMAGGTPVVYHPNPGELAFERIAAPEGAPALGLEPGFNVVFAGNLGTVQALDTVLAAAEALRQYNDVRWTLIGSGSRADWVRSEIRRRSLTSVHLPGRFAPEAMPGILAQASVLLVTLGRSSIVSQTVPSKVQAYLAAGRPIVASLDGEGARVVELAGAGVTCPAENAAALAEAVLRLRAMSPDVLNRMGEAGRRFYRENFHSGTLARRLLDHLRGERDGQ